MDASLPVERRVEDLLLRMSVEEKVGQLTQLSATPEATARIRELARGGLLGSCILASGPLAGGETQRTSDLAQTNEIQRVAVEQSRLGVPLLYGRDIIHGHRTVFPIPLGLAASWDPELLRKACRVAAREASSCGVRWTFAPMVDIARDPRWGRVAEGYGEDPFLASAFARAAVAGFQGEKLDAPDSLLACAKHFAGYGAAEGGRDYTQTEISLDTLRNVYLPPFRAAVDAGAATLMSGFHEIGGEPVTASALLLTDILRNEWGFKGFVISDWAAVAQLVRQGYARDRTEAAEKAFTAGVDMDMSDECFPECLPALVRTGRIAQARLDEAVRLVLRAKFLLGLFEKPYTDAAPAAFLTPEHRALAREAAAHCMVLLKNRGHVLPLERGARIAVLGPLVEDKRAMMGTWTMDGVAADVVSMAEGIRAADPSARVSSGMQAGRAAVDLPGAIVYVCGETADRSGESANVQSLSLPPGQAEEIKRLAGMGIPLVVVVCAGRPLVLTEIEPVADAIVYAWHPGVEAGHALADILFGAVSPSGRLPITLPRSTGQVPIYYGHKRNGRLIHEYYASDPADPARRLSTGADQFAYVDGTGAPLYPFGFGLSYASFHYEGIAVDRASVPMGGAVTISATVVNTGDRAADEVAQCYVCDEAASRTRPIRELKGFRKIRLAAGERTRVEFRLGPRELGYHRPDGTFASEPGAFTAWIGGSSLASLSTRFELA
jgi:beta-glucosidase